MVSTELQGEEPVSQGSRLCRVIWQGHWGARTLFDRFIVILFVTLHNRLTLSRWDFDKFF